MIGSIVPFGRFVQSLSNAWGTFWNTWTQPQQPIGPFKPQGSFYDMWWAYYMNTIFEDPSMWTGLYQRAGMYRHMRPVYNPVQRIVNFYTGAIYPGALSVDGEKLPEGVPSAIPLADNTDQQLKAAIAQIWQWANVQNLKNRMLRWSAALGECLIEVIDDPQDGQVYFNLVWPGQVSDIERDPRGYLRKYALEYQTADENGERYTYRKVVTIQSVSTFRDDEPYAYGDMPAVWENLYGFVPAVWLMHRDIGGPHGSPALEGAFNKIARMMSLGSHIHDQVHKAIGAPIVLWTDGDFKSRSLTPLTGGSVNRKRTDDVSLTLDPESVLILKGPANGNAQTLLGSLSLEEALKVLQSLQDEIAADQPVLRMYQELRNMSQLTGPAAERLIGDARNYIQEAADLADHQMIRLHQMAIAIAGWRANNGSWGSRDSLTPQQKKFLPFNLDSLKRGNLDFTIMPRPLIPVTRSEQAGTAVQIYTAALNGARAGLPLDVLMRKLGWADDDVQAVVDHLDEVQQQKEGEAQAQLDQKLQIAQIQADTAAKHQESAATVATASNIGGNQNEESANAQSTANAQT